MLEIIYVAVSPVHWWDYGGPQRFKICPKNISNVGFWTVERWNLTILQNKSLADLNELWRTHMNKL